jgi:hypothetical protein
MEIKSAKGFVGFLLTFMAAGAAWLALSYRIIERIVKRWR